MTRRPARAVLVVVWLLVVAATLYGFAFHRTDLQDRLGNLAGGSGVLGAAAYLLLGCARGFSLVPVTSLLILGLPFFPPAWLFVLTLTGILVSSACIYRFSEALHLGELIRARHGHGLARWRDTVQRHGLAVIAGWSFFPLAPTDAICYLAGVLNLGLAKCLLGVGLGEGAICAVYIFVGDHVLRFLQLK